MAGPNVKVTSDGSALGQLQDQFGQFSRELARGFQIFTGGALARSVRDAVSALPQAIGQVRQQFDQLGKLSATLDETPEMVQRLDMAARMSGSSVETLSRSMLNLEQSLAGIEGSSRRQSALRTLGLDADMLRTARPEERVAMLADAYSQATDRGEALEAISALMGTRVRELIPLFAQGGDRVRAMTRELDTLSAADTRTIEEFNDQLALMGRNIQVAIARAFTGELENMQGTITRVTNSIQSMARWVSNNMVLIRTLATVIGTLIAAKMLARTAAIAKAMALQLVGRSAAGATAQVTGLTAAMRRFAAGSALALGTVMVGFSAFIQRLEQAVRATEEAQARANRIIRDFGAGEVQGRVTSEADRERELERINELREEEQRKLNEVLQMDRFGRGEAIDEAIRAHDQNLRLLQMARDAVAGLTDEQMQAASAARMAEQAARDHAEALAEAARNVGKMREAYEATLARIEDQRAKDLPLTEQVERLEQQLDEAMQAARALAEEMEDGTGGAVKDMEQLAATLAEGTEDQRAAASQLLEHLTAVAQLEEGIRQLKSQAVTEAERQAEREAAAAERKRRALQDFEHELALLEAETSAQAEQVALLESEARIRQDIVRLMEAGVDATEAGQRARALEQAREARDEAEAERRRQQSRESLDDLMGALELREQTGDSPAARAAIRARDRVRELMEQFGDGGLTDEQARDIALREQALEGAGGRGPGGGVGAVSSLAAIGGGGGIEVLTRDLAADQLSELRQVRQILERLQDNEAVL